MEGKKEENRMAVKKKKRGKWGSAQPFKYPCFRARCKYKGLNSSMRGFAWVCMDLRVFAQICVDLCGFAWICMVCVDLC